MIVDQPNVLQPVNLSRCAFSAWHNPIQPAALAPDPGGGVTRPAAVAGPVGTYSYAIALSTFNRAARIAGMTAAATPTTAESTR